jgi:hypothetical protein
MFLVSDDTGQLETCFDLTDATNAALDMLATSGMFLFQRIA